MNASHGGPGAYSLHLPPQADEATFRVGWLAGKTVAVAAQNRYCGGGVGLIRQRIPLAEIVAVAPVRNAWLYGWGIHRTPHGWLYHGSGCEAAEIALASGQQLRLGNG